jgi:hypothetical protein
MKYTVSVSIEVEAEDSEMAAALGYVLLNDETPRTLSVKDAASMNKDITLDSSLALDLREVAFADAKQLVEIVESMTRA